MGIWWVVEVGSMPTSAHSSGFMEEYGYLYAFELVLKLVAQTAAFYHYCGPLMRGRAQSERRTEILHVVSRLHCKLEKMFSKRSLV